MSYGIDLERFFAEPTTRYHEELVGLTDRALAGTRNTIMRRAAIEGIREDPLAFGGGVARSLVQQLGRPSSSCRPREAGRAAGLDRRRRRRGSTSERGRLETCRELQLLALAPRQRLRRGVDITGRPSRRRRDPGSCVVSIASRRGSGAEARAEPRRLRRRDGLGQPGEPPLPARLAVASRRRGRGGSPPTRRCRACRRPLARRGADAPRHGALRAAGAEFGAPFLPAFVLLGLAGLLGRQAPRAP